MSFEVKQEFVTSFDHHSPPPDLFLTRELERPCELLDIPMSKSYFWALLCDDGKHWTEFVEDWVNTSLY